MKTRREALGTLGAFVPAIGAVAGLALADRARPIDDELEAPQGAIAFDPDGEMRIFTISPPDEATRAEFERLIAETRRDPYAAVIFQHPLTVEYRRA